MVKLWLYRNKNLWRYEIEPAAARQWLTDLLLLARSIEEIPPPREPMQESPLEKVARSNWNKWMWAFVVVLAVGLPLCGALIAVLMLTLDKRSSNRHSAEQVMLQYRKGDEVLVAYNPRNPARAVLRVGTQGVTWQGVIIFGLFAVAGALWMGFTLRNHKLRTGAYI